MNNSVLVIQTMFLTTSKSDSKAFVPEDSSKISFRSLVYVSILCVVLLLLLLAGLFCILRRPAKVEVSKSQITNRARMPTPVIIRRPWETNLTYFDHYSTIDRVSNRNSTVSDGLYIDIYEM